MKIKEIQFGSAEYNASLLLRYELLRQPLGLTLSEFDLDKEEQQLHFGAFVDVTIIGCVILKPMTTGIIKLRQMAVRDAYQGTGVGKALVEFSLNHAQIMGFRQVECHARVVAKNFYQKLGFRSEGDEFIEVTVPTLRMIKGLDT